MTGTTAHGTRPIDTVRAAQLALALAIGATFGSIATIQFVGSVDGPAAVAPNEAAQQNVAGDRLATTTAAEQYVGWYIRPAEGAAAWERATRQYVDWYTRPTTTTNLAGSTTATEQYMNWYLRDE